MLLPIFVMRSGQIGVPPHPKLLDELILLVSCRKAIEYISFIVGDDVHNILINPLPEIVLGFLFHGFPHILLIGLI
jgi:hypothetical protein